MASAQEVSEELLGTNAPEGHHDTVLHEGGPASLRHVARTVQDKLSHAAREVTLWLPRRPLATLLGKRKDNDTTLGHAIDAASYGDVNYRILAKIAAKLGVDISDVT